MPAVMRGLKQYYGFRWVLPGLAAAYFGGAAQALDPKREMSQYIRDQWGVEQGFPAGAVYAIAETNDGYLWVGAEEGLVRFDGFTFGLFNDANLAALPAGPVQGLTTDTDVNLWIQRQRV